MLASLLRLSSELQWQSFTNTALTVTLRTTAILLCAYCGLTASKQREWGTVAEGQGATSILSSVNHAGYRAASISLIPIRITIIAIAVAAFFEAIQITWLRGFSLFVGSSKSFTPSSLLTLLYIDCSRNFSISHRRSEVNDIVYLEQR